MIRTGMFQLIPVGTTVTVAAEGGGGGGVSACYVSGTRIAVPGGTRPIDDLEVGAMVLTASGQQRPVKWLGYRTVHCDKSPNPRSIWPIRVRANALGDNQPIRDLLVSPGHSFLIDGSLYQACNLVNDATIVQMPVPTVEYWHVELDTHDILLAENAPAESYLDTGNRSSFANGGTFVDAHPDFQPKHWTETCVPLITEGPELHRARQLLLDRARQLGFESTGEPDLYLQADGARIDPIRLQENRYAFTLPAGCALIELRSRTFVPAHMVADGHDWRSLGVSVARLQIDGVESPLEQLDAFGPGWHALEESADARRWRWTDGSARLPAGCRLVLIELYPWSCYWQEPARATTRSVDAA